MITTRLLKARVQKVYEGSNTELCIKYKHTVLINNIFMIVNVHGKGNNVSYIKLYWGLEKQILCDSTSLFSLNLLVFLLLLSQLLVGIDL